MKPLVPLSPAGERRRRGAAEDQPPTHSGPCPDLAPLPPFMPCRLDFREGCYQINFRPTGSLVTFEGTLRVDRSAPDGGADNLIVSGDLYSRLPVIGPVTPVPPVVRAPSADEAGEAIASVPMSVAGALSTVDQRRSRRCRF